jgi:ribonuclease D
VYITDTDQLKTFLGSIADTSLLAVDTEFLRERSYYPKLCLIQLATDSVSAVVDPILIEDLSPLAGILGDPDVTKILHACGQDLEVLYHALGGVVVTPIFDTQIGAAFLGQKMQIGYGNLVEAYTGVHLAKVESLTDWSKRPLREEQLRYAEEDVAYLPGIYRTMMKKFTEQNRLMWVKPEMDKLSDPSRFKDSPESAYLHLRRSNSLSRRQLAVARNVCAWRETIASKRDIPKRWVLADEVIVECCKRAPTTVEKLLQIRGTEHLKQPMLEGLLTAIKEGKDCPPAQYPEIHHHSHPSPEAESVVDLMNALLRVQAEKVNVAPQMIATHNDLSQFLNHEKGSPLHATWREDVIGSYLHRLLVGEIGLTVKDGHIEIL